MPSLLAGPAGANQELGGSGRGAGRGAAAAKPTGAPAGASAAAGGAAGAAAGGTNLNESNFDSFAGYQERLFGDTPYDEDDAEADRIYAQVDDEMDARTAKRRAKAEADATRVSRLSETRIADQFADLKRQLASVPAEAWEAIPDIGDRSIKKKKPDSFTPVPDSVIEMGRADTKLAGAVVAAGGAETTMTGFSAAREQMLSIKLDRSAWGGILPPPIAAHPPSAGPRSVRLRLGPDCRRPQGIPDVSVEPDDGFLWWVVEGKRLWLWGPTAPCLPLPPRVRHRGHQEGAPPPQVRHHDEPEARAGLDRCGAPRGAGGEGDEREGRGYLEI